MGVGENSPVGGQDGEPVAAGCGDNDAIAWILVLPCRQAGGVDGDFRGEFDHLHAIPRQGDTEPVGERHAENQLAGGFLAGNFQQADAG
jgi:hypothetical protein